MDHLPETTVGTGGWSALVRNYLPSRHRVEAGSAKRFLSVGPGAKQAKKTGPFHRLNLNEAGPKVRATAEPQC